MKQRNEKPRGYIFSTLLLIATVLLCLCFSVQVLTKGYVSLGGYSVFRVVTGSMEPTIPTGALLLNRAVPIETIQEDDIICFEARIQEIRGTAITHRVTAIDKDENGRIRLETRGDANHVADAYYVDEANLIGRVEWYSGKENLLTKMLTFLSGKIGFFACIVFPLLLVGGLFLQGSVKNLRKDITLLRQEILNTPEEEVPLAKETGDLLPGYSTLTYQDYQEIYQTLRDEIIEELYGLVEESHSKTE